MKNRFLALMVTVVIAGAGWVLSAQAAGTIVNSKHDLTKVAGLDTKGEICIVCHTPHNADITTQDAPLWNHKLQTTNYTLYDSPTFNGKADISQPAGVSKLCLSCHDGTVALDAFTGHAGSGAMITGAGNLGTNLKKSHPVSFTFDAALVAADGELKLPPVGWVNNGKFECSSCHDVHNKTGVGAMLHKANTNSALCLECHVK